MDEKFIEPIMKDFVDAHYPLYNAFSGQTFVKDEGEFLRIELLVKLPRTGQVFTKGMKLAQPATGDDVIGACRSLARSLHRTMSFMAIRYYSEKPDFFDRSRDRYLRLKMPYCRLKEFLKRIKLAYRRVVETFVSHEADPGRQDY